MSVTREQLIDLGFKPSKRSSLYNKKYDTLIYPLNETDFIYLGYNQYNKLVNNKILWKSFKREETGERITYPVIHLGDTSYTEVKDFLRRSIRSGSYINEEPIKTEVIEKWNYSPTGIIIDEKITTEIPNGESN